MWEFHDKKIKQLKQKYNRANKQLQLRLQEIFDTFKFDFEHIYNIADNKTKQRINTYIEVWRNKSLLDGYFGILANNIYKRTRAKNSEILELLIYSAYIEEQNEVQETELNTFKEVANYYYQQGQEEVQPNKKKYSIIPDTIFLALLDLPNAKGYSFNQYIEAIIRYNTEQVLRQATINIQQQKYLKIDSDEFQRIIQKQQNSKLNINENKISGDIDLTLIGINNNAKIEGIGYFDNEAEVEFISIHDEKRTKMCASLDGQRFKVHGWNEFYRYSKINDTIKKYKCYGLITGLNLPPINDGFHWCRSWIRYVNSIENVEKHWYNKLGNNNKNNVGGSGKGTFIEQINENQINQKLKEYEEDIRNMQIEYGILIDNEGNVYEYEGTRYNLDITDRKLDNVIITHNHPEIGSFGKDDFEMLKNNPNIKELRAVDKEYNYSLKLLKPIDITYNELWIESGDIMMNTLEESQHCTMLKLEEMGYIKYVRSRKK